MGILNIFGKRDAASDITKGTPFSISTELNPYRLQAKKSSSATLRIKVRNVTKDVLLTSVVAKTPLKIGFDNMLMQREKEVRIGDLQPEELKEISFDLYSGNASDPGEYTLILTTFAHYRDYAHVLNYVKKDIAVSVV